MLLFVVVTVFVAGLMVGRTPEYLGKKIGGREIKLTMIGVLVMPVGLLIMLAAAVTTDAGTASIFNDGPRASARRTTPTPPSSTTTERLRRLRRHRMSATLGGVAMLIGRFVPILAVLALAEPSRRSRSRPSARARCARPPPRSWRP